MSPVMFDVHQKDKLIIETLASTIWLSLLRNDSHWVKWQLFLKWRHFPNDLDHLLVTPSYFY